MSGLRGEVLGSGMEIAQPAMLRLNDRRIAQFRFLNGYIRPSSNEPVTEVWESRLQASGCLTGHPVPTNINGASALRFALPSLAADGSQ
jgi:hypothetical protein